MRNKDYPISPWASSGAPNHSYPCIANDGPYQHHSSGSQRHEQLRARELLRYYTPASSVCIAAPANLTANPSWDKTPRLVTSPSDADNTQSIDIAPENRVFEGARAVLQSSEDPALMAFAQLLALKLNCERSMVSFLDRSKQYIAAEATPTLSINETMQPSMQLMPGGLWLGCEIIPSEGGLCINTIQLYPDRDLDSHVTENEPFVIFEVPDLALDPRFKDRDYVENFPRLRFYAATPLRTPRGYNIGSLCILDSKPRVLSENERQTLGKMGELVMQHLELSAERKALRRNQRMAECLGRFASDNHFQPAMGAAERRRTPAPHTLETLKATFSHASELIRDALQGDGVVFVDADMVYDTSHSFRGNDPLCGARAKSAILGWSCVIEWNWDEMGIEEGKTDREDYPHAPGGPRARGIVPSNDILQQMLAMYPSGSILCFDDPTSGTSTTPTDSELDQGELIFRAVQDFLPNASSVIFLPLFQFGKPYAASFSWIHDSRRVISDDELRYMRGFMTLIMAEVSRLSAISADKAKGEFISSISHELRSPLHGVLGSAEFLAGTGLSSLQRNFVDTVESCGRMLLDTINHVLDFRKLTGLMQNRLDTVGEPMNPEDGFGSLPAGRRTPSYRAVASPIEAIDISVITEQVIESVYSGRKYKGFHSTASTPPDGFGTETGLFNNSIAFSETFYDHPYVGDSVTVILDIDKREDWTFVTQPGAIRRIFMNIFGKRWYFMSVHALTISSANALKYTGQGWVRVQLKAQDLPAESDGPEKSKVMFTVSDSGRGISQEFIKTKLFVPFSQENVYTSGTGLGMSIVRQILQLLGGDIEVKSRVNVGTEISITLVLERPSKADVTESSELSIIQQTRRLTEGKTVSLRGFNDLSSIEESASRDALYALHGSIVRYARDWFGMTVEYGPQIDHPSADVVLANESQAVIHYLKQPASSKTKLRAPLLVLCNNISRYRTYAASGDLLEFASKPCGPLKLAKALNICLERTEHNRAKQGNIDYSHESH
ncbi:hypothetical protein HWV62_37151 [Athelia sp. TMB]|nr:hypothetical protein HWV62_37151 [Athelia sp. TMB]